MFGRGDRTRTYTSRVKVCCANRYTTPQQIWQSPTESNRAQSDLESNSPSLGTLATTKPRNCSALPRTALALPRRAFLAKILSGPNGRFRTCGLMLPKHALCLLSYTRILFLAPHLGVEPSSQALTVLPHAPCVTRNCFATVKTLLMACPHFSLIDRCNGKRAL